MVLTLWSPLTPAPILAQRQFRIRKAIVISNNQPNARFFVVGQFWKVGFQFFERAFLLLPTDLSRASTRTTRHISCAAPCLPSTRKVWLFQSDKSDSILVVSIAPLLERCKYLVKTSALGHSLTLRPPCLQFNLLTAPAAAAESQKPPRSLHTSRIRSSQSIL